MKKPTIYFRFLLSIFLILASPTAFSAETLDLSGEWKLALDPSDLGIAAGPSGWAFNDTISLPTTLTLAGKGNPLSINLNLEKPAMENLHQRHSYIGPAWYQKEVEVPEAWGKMDVELDLERVLWESRVWINGKEAGMRDSLSVPHRYGVGDLLRPGKNTITLRIDNREKLPIGIGHAYTNATQTIWNGVVGEISLTAAPKVRIDHVKIRPQPDGKLTAEMTLANTSGETVSATYKVVATHPNGTALPPVEGALKVAEGEGKHTISIDLGNDPAKWSEFDPAVYTVKFSLKSSAGISEVSETSGYRIFKAVGRGLQNNGQPIFLRGTVDCCIFPETGHPDMTGAQWEKMFSTARAHGLNHVRFHSWCPPKVAFEVADRLGFYLQVELPNWSFKMGQVPELDAYFQTEGERILREYGNHPSFVMFSLGNELAGDLAAMDKLVAHFKIIDPDKIFTSTSYAFSPRGLLPGPEDDFFISQQTKSGWVRGQGFLNEKFPSTNTDYAEGMECLEIPLVTHEVGQYVVYPNIAELPKYANGPLRSTALESIMIDLAGKDLLADAPRFTRDSGKLAALLYKEDVERALRTKDLAGIQLLQLADFPGQSTATVGILDAFWDSKGLIEPADFAAFAGPTVPLVRMEKMVWENSETFTADLEIANFGAAPFKNATVEWSLSDSSGKNAASGKIEALDIPLGNGIPLGKISTPLNSITTASQLTLRVSIAGENIANSWSVWVYPTAEIERESGEFEIYEAATAECLATLTAGKTVLLLPPAEAIKKNLPARFIPVFWSPLHFPDQPGTLGATIDTEHPLWKNFPTDSHTNWQWWELTAESHAVDLTGMDKAIAKPFRFVDKYNRNALPTGIFEARVGSGKLLVCTLDVSTDLEKRIVARQLRRALEAYAASQEFNPQGELSPEQLTSLINEKISESSDPAEKPKDVKELGIVPGFNDQSK